MFAVKSVYTTDSTGVVTNQNLFSTKDSVYVRNTIDGTYYFQVTDPNGSTLLSTDTAACRQMVVSGGIVNTSISGGCAHGLSGNSVQLMSYSDTPNGGGEYKVSVIPQSCATVNGDGYTLSVINGCGKKTDNFKVCPLTGCGAVPPPHSNISGVIFFDANANGVKDAGEPPLAGWKINLTLAPGGAASAITDANGAWTYNAEAGTSYTACEEIPAGTGWEQKYPANNQCWIGSFDTADTTDLDFGDALRLGGKKYYDTSANGQFDSGEPGIAGFRILIGFCNVASPCSYSPATTVTTDVNGAWSLYSPLPPNGVNTFEACEILPTGTYKQTGPLAGASNGGTATAVTPGGGSSRCWLGTVSAATGANANLDFGNVCLGAGNAKSKGWWQNSGNSSITDAALATLAADNLRNADGSNFDPASGSAGRTQVKNFLSGATATNMANMLSAQFATLRLDVLVWGTNGNSIVYAPGSVSGGVTGYASLNSLFTETNTELGLHASTLSGTARTYQEALKNAFDNAANNLNFVQPGACPVVYP
jgi:hypothetical protein